MHSQLHARLHERTHAQAGGSTAARMHPARTLALATAHESTAPHHTRVARHMEPLRKGTFCLALQCWCTGYLVLNFMWWKFLVLWRFFRLWAMWDGITVAGVAAGSPVLYIALRGSAGRAIGRTRREVPTAENMERCMNNNMSFTGFWRGWHASFNQFIIRSVPCRAVPCRAAIPWSVRCARCSTAALTRVH